MQEAWLWRISAALNDGNLRLAAALVRLYAHIFGVSYMMEGLYLDWPSCGSGHVPDAPTEHEAKCCLINCNPLRAAWVERLEYAEKTEAERHSVENVPDGQGADIKARLQRLGRNA